MISYSLAGLLRHVSRANSTPRLIRISVAPDMQEPHNATWQGESNFGFLTLKHNVDSQGVESEPLLDLLGSVKSKKTT